MSYYSYPKYVSVAQKRATAEKKIKQLRKKNPDICPVILEGKALAKTWWGKSWNNNLESYADYVNRIGRGRSYVRNLAVVDLRIEPGKVTSLVNGSTLYKVEITIDKMKKQNWQTIRQECQSQLSSLPDLLAGKFPKQLQDIFLVQGKGLFPTPEEITLNCNCPDWATMCKHVAATLYGVGVRLDEDPSLFFTLRQVNMDDLISQAVQEKTASILKGGKSTGKKKNVIADDQLEDLFGIAMDDFAPPAPVKKKSKKAKKKAVKKKPVERDIEKKLAKALAAKQKKQSGKNNKQQSRQSHPTAIALVAHCIEDSTSGLTIRELEKATGFPARKLYGILYRLKQQGRVESPARGIYSHT